MQLPEKMRAITRQTYGSPDVLKLSEIARPNPKRGEVLVRVHAASVNAADKHLLYGTPFPIRLMFGLFSPPSTVGADLAGVVAAVPEGSDSTLKVGDKVYGFCQVGAFADYCCVKTKSLAAMPKNFTFEEAATVPLAASTALDALRLTPIKEGDVVAVNGASGGVGTFTVQIAKSFGAKVFAVTRAENFDLMKSIGADEVIDYKQKDFTAEENAYDYIVDCFGNKTLRDYERCMKTPGTTSVAAFQDMSIIPAMMSRSIFSSKSKSQKIENFLAETNAKDLTELARLCEEGKIKPVIDSRYPLEEAADALRRYEKGGINGKIIINVVPEETKSESSE